MAKLRRVVVGADSSGSSPVSDSAVESQAFGGPGTPRIAVLWEERWTAAGWSSADPAQPYSPLPGADAVRFVELVLPAHDAPLPADAFDIPLHSTPTIDLLFVARGEAELVLDTGAVTLAAGDYLVMRGDVHGWRNVGPEECVLVAAMAGTG